MVMKSPLKKDFVFIILCFQLIVLLSSLLHSTAEARDCLYQFRNEGPEKTRIKKKENSPTRLHVETVVLSRFIQLLLENFSGFRSASLEHNASSAERVLPTLGAKIGNKFESCKGKGEKSEKFSGNIWKIRK